MEVKGVTTLPDPRVRLALALLAACALAPAGTLAGGGAAGNRAEAVGEPVLEPATMHSLGTYWIVRGDANRNARVEVDYRPANVREWRKGPPLFRVEKGAHRPEGKPGSVDVPADAWLFAGSVVLLQPGTAYELLLRLSDPDGPDITRVLPARTAAEPAFPQPARTLHVAPSAGGGTGTQADPFRGLAAAQAAARPGDLLLLHAGVYEGSFHATRSGEPGRPIVRQGAGDGQAVLDGQGKEPKRPARAVDATGIHDVWFEDLTIRNADYGIVAHDSARLVVRRCAIRGVEFGLAATRNTGDRTRELFISDNVIEGPSTWPRTKGIEDARGIQVSGTGHEVCYNRIRGFADAVDTFPSPRCADIDFHHNDVSVMTDDGMEMDYSERNTRCFENRFTNIFQGVSVQPVYGGPVYIFRNVLYNVVVEPFKMHNSPSGALFLHNTCVKKGEAHLVWTSAKVSNCVSRNNLFIGAGGRAAFDCDSPMVDCDFDYDGFGGGPWTFFLKWNGARYATLEETRSRAPVYRHAVQVDPAAVFATNLRPPADEKQAVDGSRLDFRLKRGPAVDAGEPLPGFNNGFAGRAPDLGAYELGGEPVHYGPRQAAGRGRS